MAYNTQTTTTSSGKVIYYGGSLGEWDNDILGEEKEEEIEVPTDVVPPTESKKSKVLIWGALIAAALYIFK